MKKIKIRNQGFTNISYKLENFFIQKKVPNRFTHKIDYHILKHFDFVPEFFQEKDGELWWKWIEGQNLAIWTNENLQKIANIMRKIHTSKLKFPKFNLASRVKEYIKIINEKNLKIDVINIYYKKVNKFLAKMNKTVPCHGDFFASNLILEDKTNKIFVVDWEYAFLGDFHFDLAYFIESSKLNLEQEKNFLNFYGLDNINLDYLKNQKIIVNYLVILWVNAQKIKHFDDKNFILRLQQLNK